MSQEISSERCYLLVRARGWLCGLPLEEVEETMRLLPLQPLGVSLPFVRGVAMVRGAPTPVVSLGALLGGELGEPRRLVSLRLPERRLALEVEQVLGLRWLGAQVLQEAPPLVQAGSVSHLEALGALDGQVLAVLSATRVLPVEVWDRLQGREVGA